MKTHTASNNPPPMNSLTLPIPAVPTVWKIAAADLGFQSVEEWAAAMLDIMSWPGNRLTLTPHREQFRRWMEAARFQNMILTDWIPHTLDAASEAVKSDPTAGICLDAGTVAKLRAKLREMRSDHTVQSIIDKMLADTLEDGWLECIAAEPQTAPQS